MARPQEAHADLGLIEDDNTEDLRCHRGIDSKKPPVHPTKNVTEGSESTTTRK